MPPDVTLDRWDAAPGGVPHRVDPDRPVGIVGRLVDAVRAFREQKATRRPNYSRHVWLAGVRRCNWRSARAEFVGEEEWSGWSVVGPPSGDHLDVPYGFGREFDSVALHVQRFWRSASSTAFAGTAWPARNYSDSPMAAWRRWRSSSSRSSTFSLALE
jgi:hypothetical protein